VGNKENSRGKGNRGLVYYYEDGDDDGNGYCDCLRGKGVGQMGERENRRMGLFLFIVFIFDGGEEDCFMLSYFLIVCCLSLFNASHLISHQVQVNCWTVISCRISFAVQIWSSHFCLANIV
jgi:hypothetical protein